MTVVFRKVMLLFCIEFGIESVRLGDDADRRLFLIDAFLLNGPRLPADAVWHLRCVR